MISQITVSVNPFPANVPILHSLKTTENQRFSGIFRGYKMGILARNGLILIGNTSQSGTRVKDYNFPGKTRRIFCTSRREMLNKAGGFCGRVL